MLCYAMLCYATLCYAKALLHRRALLEETPCSPTYAPVIASQFRQWLLCSVGSRALGVERIKAAVQYTDTHISHSVAFASAQARSLTGHCYC